MNKLKKLIVFLIAFTTIICLSTSAYAISFSGSSSAGSYGSVSGATQGKGTSIPTKTSAGMIGYRISIVNETTGYTVTTMNFRNESNYTVSNGYNNVLVNTKDYNYSQNKVDLITTTNGNYEFMSASSSGTPLTYWADLPDCDNIEDWASFYYQDILTKLGYSESQLASGDMIIIEPMFALRFSYTYCVMTISDLAILGIAYFDEGSYGLDDGYDEGSWGYIGALLITV